MIELRTLGTLDLRESGGPPARSVLAQPRRTALLLFLALARPAGLHRRETLMGLFWGERDQERARKALRQSLYYLRLSLGEDVLVTVGDTEVGVSPAHLRSDVADMLQALEEHRTDDAFALFTGDLLPGFHIDDAPEFERWLEAERSFLRQRLAAAAWTAAGRARSANLPADAVRWARKALEVSSADEAAARELIRELAASGETAAALQVYEELLRVLEREELAPSSQLQSEIDAIRSGSAATIQPRRQTHQETRANGEDGVHSDGVPRATSLPGPLPGGSPPVYSDAAPAPHWLRYAAIAGGLLLAAGLLYASTAAGPDTADRAAPIDVRLIRVVPFSAAGVSDEAGRIAADWLIQGIAAADVDVVPLGLDDWSGEPVRQQSDMDRRPGLLLTGGIVEERDSLHLSAMLKDWRGRSVGLLQPVVAARSDLMPAIERMRQQVISVLATHFNEDQAAWGNAARPPTSFEAYQAFTAGMQAFTRLDWDDATAFYRQAVLRDSTWILPRLWLVFSLTNAGNPIEERQDVVRYLQSRRSELTRFEAALADYHLANSGLDPEAKRTSAAYRASRRLTDLLPESEWLWIQAFTALSENRPLEAARTLRRADPDRGWLRSWPEYWNFLPMALHYSGDFQGAYQAARAGRDRFPGHRGALEEMGAALSAQGITSALDSLALAADNVEAEAFQGAIGVRHYWGNDLIAHGFQEEGERQLQLSLEAWSALSEQTKRLPAYRLLHGITLHELGRNGEARVVLHELATETAEPEARVWAAVAAVALGDAAEATELLRELASSKHPARFTHSIILHEALGQPAEATDALRRALTDVTVGPVWFQDLHYSGWFRRLVRDYPPFAELARPKG